VAE
jgi:hypothetical protein